ncbi:DUF2489 domain-containing protein [Thalassotalea profundi]|uniref:DUF2489 domain-containing protein n=1 Tax=Thalassotalea profundi TaxID=2036687 RepID=A0ABQ3IM87_9GAMM|nr:DUF2489 domain-containing protein [Thalassotalea profundi]GHE88386.1 hypothetical protein GCM10011501_17240 [Thalassotalea profundi]
MFENYSVILIVCAVVIIAALSFYAGKLLFQLRRQTQLQDEILRANKKAHNEHDTKVLNSVVIIVRAMKEDQCDYSEGCWRLSVLLDSLKTAEGLEQEFPAIFELYHAIKHMPIMQERKKLAKQERMKLDLERTKAEARLTPTIVKELTSLHQYALDKIVIIS